MNAPFAADNAHLLKFGIGQPVPRQEDPTLLKGQGRYSDDVQLPNTAHAVMVRTFALGKYDVTSEEFLAFLREVQADPGGEDPPFVDLILRYGIAYAEFNVEWCKREEKRLSRKEAA